MQHNYYNNSAKVRVYASSAQGGRKYMEDEYALVQYKLPLNHNNKDVLQRPFMFFGIFDGHGGEMAAQYSRDHLCRNIVKQKEFWSQDNRKVCLAIHRGFVRTQRDMLNEVGKWPKTSTGLPSTAGTTASIVFVMNGHYYTGHVGDSRIVLGRQTRHSNQWIACPMTRDHKPESPREKERIEASGGQVMNKSGVGRVVWNRPKPQLNPNSDCESQSYDVIPFLAVARALGDLWSLNKSSDTFIVSPEPDVHCIPIDPSDRCLILASDGLWNMVNNQTAIKVVHDFEQGHKPYCLPTVGEIQQSHASQLLDVCMNRWSQSRYRADNTTVLTILFDTFDHPNPNYIPEFPEADSADEDSELTDSDDDILCQGLQNMPPFPNFGFSSQSNSSYDLLQNYYEQDEDPDDDPKDSLKLVGDTIHTIEFEEDLQTSSEAVATLVSNLIDHVCLVSDSPATADHCDYHQLSEPHPVRLSAISHLKYNELSDDQLLLTRFNHWSNPYIVTDYMQNNHSTVLTVDKTMFGNMDTWPTKNASPTPLKIVLHESQNLLESSNSDYDNCDCPSDKIEGEQVVAPIATNWTNFFNPDITSPDSTSAYLHPSSFNNFHVPNLQCKRKYDLDISIDETAISASIDQVQTYHNASNSDRLFRHFPTKKFCASNLDSTEEHGMTSASFC